LSKGASASSKINHLTRRLLPPRRKRVREGAVAGGAFFDGDDGAAAVGVDQRHVEPRPGLQQVDVARAVALDIRQPDQEEAVGDLEGETGQRRATRRASAVISLISRPAPEQIGNIFRFNFIIDIYETKKVN
jgi:hypothetical protein